ncbi:methylenetetrahydrofolate--tRNA-(uracil(54)-C(5))-methyltransferase (FADH(2)-oxidizing) TrmFO [Desulfurobacterium indicum]|uniref:Methylenetetrahydrofolate--tRNA-(uracil-5-)-methyltransferase TrmFO n=1 Tax=Desulfurobacterium indicum TaxID=1914305 RepID=A0A1R1MNH8_9BACT|nr:methylenetetrahydrofolate--tRNA-(uracil(54)-C(5))-methyltransferase (FADH(2)-oxidizing) TrmFO [Desulfurobacterium indicum]OMH41244.1 methylenetetrahydrofolate--tRNA-(uracil(54)-C(5))-methyltransferase (FADH(2)-oxidizing) TrmFO [Desulfurobacterium indicum]
MKKVHIIGAGLAGSEAAWYLARKGIPVVLYEMRPKKFTPAHRTDLFGELVCSNTLGGIDVTTARGLLKKEMEIFNSLIVEAAKKTAVPAGGALAVNRQDFAAYITEKLSQHPLIEIIREEVTKIPENEITIVATGPLTSDTFSRYLIEFLGEQSLSFYDAIAPIVYADTIDYSKCFWGSRYGKGGDDYLNCPMTKEEYERFYNALMEAEKVPLKEFEKEAYFEGCMPIEEMAERGKETLLFGPLKPVGLTNPKTGKRPYAVVQLRKENKEGTLLNLVGFQTKLTYPAQKKVFRLIPGLENVEFARYGSIHRNTFINSPKLLLPTLQLNKNANILFAGQITGVEGYPESAATGIIAGINAEKLIKNTEPVYPPPTTIIGGLLKYITEADPDRFQPMNANFGLLPVVKAKGKRARRKIQAEKALKDIKEWAGNVL